MYLFICESSNDYNAEVSVYQKLENAKKAVARRFEEYISGNYCLTKDAVEEAKNDFKESSGMYFTIELAPFEIVGCHIEEQAFSDEE